MESRQRSPPQTLGIPLLAGREFIDDERDPVAIVSQPLAQRR
jgi:hypothetical protein